MSNTSFDLGTFSQVPLAVLATDADGQPVPGVTPVFTSSDEGVLTLTDQGDGTTVAVRATVNAGSATILATVTNADGSTATGSLAVSLAAQAQPTPNVANVEIVPGIPS